MYTKNTIYCVIMMFMSPIIKSIDSNQELNAIPEYEDQFFTKKSFNLRKRFFNNKIEKQKSRMLDELSHNTIYVDGIPHIDIDKSEKKKFRIDEIENGFKSLLGMKGVKYTFKRGFKWRTWREIGEGGTGTIVCYMCKGPVEANCKDCFSGGYWVIEEKPPPCPYEILSMPNSNQLCTIHFTQYNNIQSSCPTLINMNDLLTVCNNPIETELRITPKYNNHQSSEINSTLNAVCNGRAGCHITTLYTILPDSILFKIINSSNHIIYSRVMKSNHKNYACTEDCGILDRKTKTVLKNDKPLILNLLDTDTISHKDKREYKNENVKTTAYNRYSNKNIKKLIFFSNHLQSDGIKRIVWEVTNTSNWSTPHPISMKAKPTKKTMCKKLIETNTDDYSDSVDI